MEHYISLYPTPDDPEEPDEECTCHNGHQQNDTVCTWCWDRGRRKWLDPDICTDCEKLPATNDSGLCDNCHDRAGERQDEQNAQAYYGGSSNTADYAINAAQQIAREEPIT